MEDFICKSCNKPCGEDTTFWCEKCKQPVCLPCLHMIGETSYCPSCYETVDPVELLTEIRDLARTGTPPPSWGMDGEQWKTHKLVKIAGKADHWLHKVLNVRQ